VGRSYGQLSFEDQCEIARITRVPPLQSGRQDFVGRNGMRVKIIFASRFNCMTSVQPSRGKYFNFFFSEITYDYAHPASLRGAYRDRHGTLSAGCGGREGDARAMSVRTYGASSDGEIVWSRHPDAGVKSVTMLAHRADDGGKQARRTEEITYKP
jgi:hypothetical protein